jgi:hypothetical protein
LLHGDGTNGAQNNTFLDGSTNNFTITRNGNTTQGTFSPFSLAEGEFSNFFDGTGDSLSVAANAALDVGSGDFSIDVWAYPVSKTNSVDSVFGYGNFTMMLYHNNTNWTLEMSNNGSSNQVIASFSVILNSWQYISIRKSGTGVTVYRDGVSVATGTISGSVNTSSKALNIGLNVSGSSQLFTGWISNFRLVKGTSLASVTPPTTPLTAITNTSLLTCQSNRFVDNSTNAFAITRNGDVRVTPFSPFAPTAAYSASVNGGSGYFDGSGDYLVTPNNIALAPEAGAFTWECWFYPTETWFQDASGGDGLIQSSATNGLQISRSATGGPPNGNFWGLAAAGVAFRLVTTSLPTVGQWNHMAVARSGTGTNQTALFLNGERVAQGTVTDNFAQGSYDIGRRVAGYESTGYIANMRIIKGSAEYSPANSTYTVPTAPLTAITNTSLLLNYTNAGIFDNTGKNNLETVGDAQIDTGTKKYGTGSMEFDGTGDYLVCNGSNDLYAFGTGDWTIEFWLYLNNVSGQKNLYDSVPASTTGLYPVIYMDGATLYYFTNSANRITNGSSLSASTWYHIAVARSGTSTKMFVNGTQVGSTYTDTNNYLNGGNNRPVIGGSAFTVGTNVHNGFIDDLRITKGIARYTANFTAPTKAFPDQ